jgi:predicted Zn-dependent protease
MKILLAENLKISLELMQIKKIFMEYKIPINFHYCQIKEECNIDDILRWCNKKIHEKVLIISDKEIVGKQSSYESMVRYKGFSNEIGGNVAFVRFNEENSSESILISLHEALHLYGLHHCHSPGCIMSFKLCNLEFKYCLLCAEKCNKLHLCNYCKGAFYGE